jgi:hypothetical protein
MVLGIESKLVWEFLFAHPDQLWGPPTLLRNGHWVPVPGTEQPGHGNVHLLASSAEFKESRNIPQLPLWVFVAWCRAKINSLSLSVSLLILVPFT